MSAPVKKSRSLVLGQLPQGLRSEWDVLFGEQPKHCRVQVQRSCNASHLLKAAFPGGGEHET